MDHKEQHRAKQKDTENKNGEFTKMSSGFQGVYTALYDYDAQTDEELSIKQDDILYLLEKSSTDDWWKVKKRILDADVAEPVGLVPSTYIEPTKVKSRATALYDYDKQTDEELSFKEGAVFDVYDTSDSNWTLVGVNGGSQFGFVPANYIEIGASGAPVTGETQNINAYGSSSALNKFPPPPQRAAVETEVAEGSGKAAKRDENADEGTDEDEDKAGRDQRSLKHRGSYSEDEDDAPAMPQRPGNSRKRSDSTDEEGNAPAMPSRPSRPDRPDRPKVSGEEDDEEGAGDGRTMRDIEVPPEDFYNDDFFTWKVYEIEGKKKRKATLEIGDSQVFITPEGSSRPRNWTVRDLLNYNNEKKHVFLDFKNPAASYELHAGSKDAANAIVSILADMKGMTSMAALKDIEEASKPSHRPQGKILYDFQAASSDELTCYEGDLVYIVNDKKSKDWWMVENIGTGKKGVVPSNYIKVVGEEASSGSWKKLFRRKSSSQVSLSPKKGRAKRSQRELELEREREELAARREEEERKRRSEKARLDREKEELARERRRQERRARELKTYEERQRVRAADERERAKRMKHGKRDLSKPNPHRVRTWIDRTGAFKVEAEFLGVQDGKIHLHKVNGVKIAVAAQKLSVEDLEYVERLMGVSLDKYKEMGSSRKHRGSSDRAGVARSSERIRDGQATVKSAAKPSKDSAALPVNEKVYEYWFNMFLECGVDANMCEQYARTFAQEQMDESVLEDITKPLLRTLGLKEGDVLKVMRHLDTKFARRGNSSDTKTGSQAKEQGGLFSGKDGALKDNSSKKFEDEAWAIKPASRANGKAEGEEAQAGEQAQIQPQLTGSIQDLLEIKPMEPTKKAPSPEKNPAVTPVPVKPVTTTNTNTSSVQPIAAQPTTSTVRVPLSAMPTGFVPISMIPALTGQHTGMLPVTTFGQQPTGVMALPQTTFGQVPATLVKLQPTGLAIQKTGFQQPMQAVQTGFQQPIQAVHTGFQPIQTVQTGFQPVQTGFQPIQTGFQQPMQTAQTGFQPIQTGVQPIQTGFQPIHTGVQPIQTGYQPIQTGVQPIQTGYQPFQPSLQATGQMPQTSFQQAPATSFQQAPQTSFGVNQLTGMMANASLTGQPAQLQTTQPLMAQPTGLGFGNGPQLPVQKTGRQANLANATPDNPFGF